MISLEGMRLREVREDDHGWLIDLHNDPAVLYMMTDPTPITPSHHMNWWESISRNPREKRLIFEVNGDRVGFTKFYSIDKNNHNCMLGADIHKDHRGKRYARPMWTLMLNKCFDELQLYRVSLTTATFNDVGQRVYKSLGFQEEGRLIKSLYRDGTYHDQIMMYMLRDWR